jgi:hypothetical protein
MAGSTVGVRPELLNQILTRGDGPSGKMEGVLKHGLLGQTNDMAPGEGLNEIQKLPQALISVSSLQCEPHYPSLDLFQSQRSQALGYW